MLTGKEFATLKVDQILSETQSNSGLSAEEMRTEMLTRISETLQRMKDLGIEFPIPSADSDIRLVDNSILTKGYRCKRNLPGKGIGQKAWVTTTVLTGVAIESDGKLWFHASITREDGKMPTYDDLKWLKENFFDGKWAIQVFPTSDRHVSHHDKCLHLWTCLEEFELPDFRKFGTI